MIRSSNKSTAWQFCLLLVLLLSICSAAAATNLSGTFKSPDGSFVNGKIIFLLSQPARLDDQSAQVVPMVKIFSVTNGVLETGAFVYGNDVLVPGGTYYLVRLVDSNNNLLFEQKWSISGVNLDLGTLTPTTTGVVFPDPLIKNLVTGQAVQGPVSFSAPITAFSLTLNGNLNPGAADLYDLGNSSAPWQELYAQRWNSLFAVGSSGGTALPPIAIPGGSVQSSGGTIGPGTYYFKVTYFNKNGETTASPVATLTVSSGTTNRIHIGPGDKLWLSGCYGYIVYASTDNVNFYAQTPSGVSGDFELTNAVGGAPSGKAGHYNALGSFGARFNSLTFSGSTPPSINTASIDPLQVGLNRTMRQSDFTASQGELVVPVPFSGGALSAHTLTTPLIVPRYAHIVGVSHYGVGKNDAGGSRIYGAWTDPKLAVVMTFGGFHSIENVTVFGPGNGVMYLSGVGYQAEAEIAKNSAFRTTDSTNTYAALKIVGIHYNLHHENVYLRGGKAAVQAQNLAGGEWTFKEVRWDLGGSSAIQNITGWTDPDNGANDAGFGNAAGPIRLQNLLIEQGTGILLDAVNMGVRLDHVQMADTVLAPGTDSIIKMGCDSFCVGAAGLAWWIEDSDLPGSNNVRVGTFISAGSVPSITVIRSSLGAGNSTGSFIALDANNLASLTLWLYSANVDPNPAASGANIGKLINLASAARVYSSMSPMFPNQSTSLYGWNEFPDRIVITPATNNGSNRGARQSWLNTGGPIELRGANDTQQNAIFDANGNLTLRQNLFINPIGVSASRIAIGQNTASGGSISLVNQGSIYARNIANSGDVRLGTIDSSDRAIIGDANGVCLSTSSNCAPIKGNMSATATLDFPSTSASACSDLTLAVTGASAGDPVFLGAPSASVPAGGSFFAWASAANTVTVRFCADGTARDPASGSFRATILKF